MNNKQNQNRLKVLYLATSAFGGYGGIAQYNRDLMNTLASNHSVDDIYLLMRTIDDKETSLQLPEGVIFRRKSKDGKVAYLLNLIQLLLKGVKIDLVICGHINLLPVAYLAAKAKKAKICMIVYGVEVWQTPKNVLVRYLCKKIKMLNLIAISDYTKNKFFAWSGMKVGYTLRNAIDLDRFSPGKKNPNLIKKYGVDDRKVMISLCRLNSEERYKGIDEVIDIFPNLLRSNQDILYLVGGDGDDRERLQRKVRDKQLESFIKFLGYIPEAEKVDFYRLADAFVMPGWGEGFGYVYLEAVACGVTTIGSTLDASREALQDGKLGWLVNPNNKNELIETIQKALCGKSSLLSKSIRYYSYQEFSKRVSIMIDNIS